MEKPPGGSSKPAGKPKRRVIAGDDHGGPGPKPKRAAKRSARRKFPARRDERADGAGPKGPPKKGFRGVKSSRGKPDAFSRKRGPQRRPPPPPPAPSDTMRLQKALAAAGIDSRRKCEELILAGRVTVDGEIASELGTQVNPYEQDIRLDGERVKLKRPVYYAVHKPKGVVTTNYDQAGRPRVVDLVPGGESLFAVGRLDISSEGLIIVTNDGALAQRLAHPRYEVAKTYHVEVVGMIERETMQQIHHGVKLAEAWVRPESVFIKRRHKRSTVLEMVLKEGRNREIRRLMARLGHKVVRLTRVAHGSLRLGDLPEGAHRPLTKEEVARLWTTEDAPRHEPGRGPRPPAGSRRPVGRGKTSSGERGRGRSQGNKRDFQRGEEERKPRQPHEPDTRIRRKPKKPLGSTVRKKRERGDGKP